MDLVERNNALDDHSAFLVLNRAVSGVAAIDRSLARFAYVGDVWVKTAAQVDVTTKALEDAQLTDAPDAARRILRE